MPLFRPRNAEQAQKRYVLPYYQVIEQLLISDIIRMIAGIQLSTIQPKDLHLRFLILEKILTRKEQFLRQAETPQLSREFVVKKYQNFVKQLDNLQQHMRGENSEYLNKEINYSLILTDVQRQLERCYLAAEISASQYENKMMQTWRDGIRKNEEKEKLGRKQSQSTGSNNKNLMLLTSQLLKNERNSKLLIKKEQAKLLAEIQKIRTTVKTKRQQFDRQIQKLSAFCSQKMSKASLYTQQYNQDAQKELQKLQPCLKQLREQIKAQQKSGEQLFSEFETILHDLKLKYL